MEGNGIISTAGSGLQEIQMSLCYSLLYGRQIGWSWGEKATGQIVILIMHVKTKRSLSALRSLEKWTSQMHSFKNPIM